MHGVDLVGVGGYGRGDQAGMCSLLAMAAQSFPDVRHLQYGRNILHHRYNDTHDAGAQAAAAAI